MVPQSDFLPPPKKFIKKICRSWEATRQKARTARQKENSNWQEEEAGGGGGGGEGGGHQVEAGHHNEQQLGDTGGERGGGGGDDNDDVSGFHLHTQPQLQGDHHHPQQASRNPNSHCSAFHLWKRASTIQQQSNLQQQQQSLLRQQSALWSGLRGRKSTKAGGAASLTKSQPGPSP